MPRSRSRGPASVESEDDLLSSRLASLGYSLALPPAAPATPSIPKKPLIELFMEQVEEDLRRMNRERGLEAGAAESEVGDGEGGLGAAPSAASYTTSTSSSASLPKADADLTLHDLLSLVKMHKKEALAAKASGEKKKDKRPTAAKQAEEPATPSKALGELQLSSPVKLQASPSKRRRDPSPPRTPSSSPGPSPSLSPSPCKRVAIRKKSLVGLLPLALSLAGAVKTPSAPPLVATVARLCEEIPNLSLPALVHFSQTLSPNGRILEAASERASVNGRVFGSSLNFLGKTLFSTTSSQPEDAPLATLLLARALELYPTTDPTAHPSLPLPLTPRILSTRHVLCVQCSSPLTLRNRKTSDNAFLVDTSSPAVPVVVATHQCGCCGALHAPDHVEIEQAGRRIWIWDDGADVLKVGERVWVTASLARHYRALLIEQAVSPGGFVSFWNGLYASDYASLAFDSTDDDDDEDGYSSPTPAVHVKEGRKNLKQGSFVLRARHIWRAFVLSSCFDAVRTSSSSYTAFASLARPPIEELVAFANRDLFGTTADEAASVLPAHSCAVCTRKRRRWKGGPATEQEKAAGVRWAGSHEKEHKDYVEDTKLDKTLAVQLAVCDGIEIGHPLCAYPSCPNPPEAHRRTRRFCTSHLVWHQYCGIVDCERAVSDELDDDGEITEACKLEAHQEAWQRFKKRRKEVQGRGWAGRKRRAGGRGKYEVMEVDEEVEDSAGEGETGGEESGDEDEKKPRLSKRVSHMWSLRRSTNLQLLVGACGTPLAWSKFANGETPSEVLSFLSSAHSQLDSSSASVAPSFPSYIAYDRACHVLRSLVAYPSFAGSFPPFLSSSRLIVTAFHRQGHPASDVFCSRFCNPTPLNGEAPDLVVPFREKATAKERSNGKGKEKTAKGPRTFERGFNTTAAEQLNSTLSRFAPLLSTMRANNFDFLVNVFLRHRAEEVRKRGGKGKGRKE
ncbi:hypothetical protein JCM6882_005105 [Rhodosporidiobolus microsporus]